MTKINRNELIPLFPEFQDVFKVLEFGLSKYKGSPKAWLDPAAPRMSHKQNHDSMFHHLAESFTGHDSDPESGLHPLLHLACRALMEYTRIQKGIRHELDS